MDGFNWGKVQAKPEDEKGCTTWERPTDAERAPEASRFAAATMESDTASLLTLQPSDPLLEFGAIGIGDLMLHFPDTQMLSVICVVRTTDISLGTARV
jgi:hypothetical protein